MMDVATQSALAELVAEFEGRWHIVEEPETPGILTASREPQRAHKIGGLGVDRMRQHLRDFEAGNWTF